MTVLMGQGNLLQADVEALVNSVNTVGVMGKGIALQFRQAFPDNYRAYRQAVARGEVKPGKVFVFRTQHTTPPKLILNFPTKRHWRDNARLDDLEAGLIDLVDVIREHDIASVAVPPLGCGNGRLDWQREVLPRLAEAFATLTDVRVILYQPAGAPDLSEMPIGTEPPPMTPRRAALLELLDRYLQPGDTATVLEVQKLAYLLQAAGQPLGLTFQPARYGPYDYRLHHELQRLEGHFVRGYGDRSTPGELHPLPDALAAARETLAQHPDIAERVDRAAELIEGFESPWALELLTTLHWLANTDPTVRTDPATAAERISAWSDRKRQLLQPHHIDVVWRHLQHYDWLPSEPAAATH
jgi:O-acetyl-ADP-ribose deacetylase (regulator of RNase III)